MNDAKRKLRGYKLTDSVYEKAMERASKENIPLTHFIEAFVTLYSEFGGDIFISKPKGGGWKVKTIALDVLSARLNNHSLPEYFNPKKKKPKTSNVN
jgi:hypothetical protein